MKAFHRWAALGLAGLMAACSSSSDKQAQTKSQTARIVGFSATPAEVLDGDPTILAWEVENVTQIRVEDGAGKVLVEARHSEGTVAVVPDRNQLYRLVAKGKDGKEIEQQVAVQIRPGTAPAAEFRVEPAEVPIGSPIRLIWDTSETIGVVIRSGGEVIYESDRRLSGEVELIADKAAIYTLTALGHWGKREIPAEVKVTPVILSFTAGTTEPVAKGSQTGLSWRTRGADELTIRTPEGQSWTVPPGDVDAGSMVLPMGESGTFELVASNGGFEAVQEHAVAILGAPRIHSLRATPSPITEGELFTVTVSWHVDWALDGVLSWGNGNTHKIGWMEIGAGSLDLELSEATQIVLQVRNSQATVSSSFQVTAIPEPVPSLYGPRKVGGDEIFALHWDAPGADHITLTRNGVAMDVPSAQISGIVHDEISGRTVYQLDARNPSGSVRTTSMVVDVGAPTVASFKSDRVRYGAGKPMVFTWDVNGGTRLEIFNEDGEALTGCNLGAAGGFQGSCTATTPVEFGTYSYLVEVENAEGMDARALTFRVGDGPAVDRFNADSAFVGLGSDLNLSWLVLDDVDGTVPEIRITDNLGSSWQFQGTHLQEGTLSVTAEESGTWTFTLVATVPGKQPVEAVVSVQAVGTPEVTLTSSTPTFDLATREPVDLEWVATNSSRLEVFAADVDGQPKGQPLYATSVPAEMRQGSIPVLPWRLGQHFVAVASNPLGERATDTLTLEPVGTPATPIGGFDVSQSTVSAGTPVRIDWAVWGPGVTTTLAPFLDDAPIEITATAPFINIRQSGNPLTLQNCGTIHGDLDEGCKIVNFPNGFTFPFDGLAMPGVMATANGNLSTTLSHSLGNMYSSEKFTTDATNGRPNTQFAIYWRDTQVTTANPITWELKDGPQGRHLVLQYTNNSAGNTYQAVFWESGALDYRYATMVTTSSGNGTDASMGWQDRGRTKGHNINGTARAAVPGGLANRSWRYFEKSQPNIGSVTIPVHRTTIFSLCAQTPAGRQCERRTVTVQ